ncbi:SRPBCC family protein [Defluviimonas sp. WL0050]|uniref:SRPBCC family protein n=1 Tax=Albidovulum litorale TaxID=2984134 RepID=A0ABT2ZM59_9RHOB|nr:SRPBCC family protein [Defluviimonas sp. WL0050]MCV2872199.1 SRPBCC family protein [Defluviimonas sp. WL0050]
MKFSTKEDVEVPAGEVFDFLSDFGSFERAAVRRGAEVTRVDRIAEVGPGLTWSVRFPMRGKMRRVLCELARFDRPEALNVNAESTGFHIALAVALVELSPKRTRMTVDAEIKPRTLAARLMLQSVRINKAGFVRRFEARVQKYAADLELRHLGHGVS